VRLASDAGEMTADVPTSQAARLPIGTRVACAFDPAVARVLPLNAATGNEPDPDPEPEHAHAAAAAALASEPVSAVAG
jgi:hypothetical protein